MPGRDIACKLLLQLKYLLARQMNVGHHSSRAATANAFKQGQWRFHDLGKFLDGIPLIRSQRKTCRGRNNQHAPAVFLLNLQYIPGETLELLDINVDELAACRLQTIPYPFALRGIPNGVRAKDHKPVPDTDGHVRMQYGFAVLLRSVKGYGIVAQSSADFLQDVSFVRGEMLAYAI